MAVAVRPPGAVGGVVSGTLPAALNATIAASYRWAAPNVIVDAIGPAADWTRSWVTRSLLLTELRWVKPVPAVMLVVADVSIVAPKMRSPPTVVVAAVLVIALAAVVPVPAPLAVTSTGELVARPPNSLTIRRRNARAAGKVTFTVLAPALTFGA